MKLSGANEPPIDSSLDHYMEERALAIALAKARTPEERARVDRLTGLRAALMEHRHAFSEEAIAKRHARGEIYSAARVASLNALAPTREELDLNVNGLYAEQETSEGVLRAHASTHFSSVMVSKRLGLAVTPPDIVEAARQMQAHEESFAREWIDAVDDPSFADHMRALQRDAVKMFRTASRPMYLVTHPDSEAISDEDAAALGKVWNKLDALSETLGVKPLSTFIAFDEETEVAGVPASEVLPTVTALITAIESGAHKVAAKKQVLAILAALSDSLTKTERSGGRACFDVDV